MFRNVTVAIADDDHTTCSLLHSMCSNMGFSVSVASTVRNALDLLSSSNILILDWSLNSGDRTAGLVLDKWIELGGGPVCVMVDESDEDFRTSVMIRGAYNVISKPVDCTLYQAILWRYGRIVMTEKSVDDLRNKVAALRKWVIASISISIAVAIGGGPTFVQTLINLLASIM